MRTAAAILVVLVASSSVQADPGARAVAVIDGLRVDDATADKLLAVVTAYDKELSRLQRQRIEVKRRLVLAANDQPKQVDVLLDDAIANQRALAHNEEQLIRRTKKLLGPKRAAELLVLLAATEPDRAEDARPATLADVPEARTGYDPDALFPPKSARPPCNPFAEMHGCRN
jgi:hypothetical protein